MTRLDLAMNIEIKTIDKLIVLAAAIAVLSSVSLTVLAWVREGPWHALPLLLWTVAVTTGVLIVARDLRGQRRSSRQGER